MPTTSPTGLTTPTSGDANNPPADMLTLAGQLDLTTIPLFASTGTRDTAYASRAFGMCFVGASRDAGTLYVRRGGAFHVMTDTDVTLPRVFVAAAGGFTSTLNVSRANGVILLTGYIYAPGGYATTMGSTAIATIPAGYRTPEKVAGPAVFGITSDYSDWCQPGGYTIDTSGGIKVARSPLTAVQYYVSFDGIALRGI